MKKKHLESKGDKLTFPSTTCSLALSSSFAKHLIIHLGHSDYAGDTAKNEFLGQNQNSGSGLKSAGEKEEDDGQGKFGSQFIREAGGGGPENKARERMMNCYFTTRPYNTTYAASLLPLSSDFD